MKLFKVNNKISYLDCIVYLFCNRANTSTKLTIGPKYIYSHWLLKVKWYSIICEVGDAVAQ